MDKQDLVLVSSGLKKKRWSPCCLLACCPFTSSPPFCLPRENGSGPFQCSPFPADTVLGSVSRGRRGDHAEASLLGQVGIGMPPKRHLPMSTSPSILKGRFPAVPQQLLRYGCVHSNSLDLSLEWEEGAAYFCPLPWLRPTAPIPICLNSLYFSLPNPSLSQKPILVSESILHLPCSHCSVASLSWWDPGNAFA